VRGWTCLVALACPVGALGYCPAPDLVGGAFHNCVQMARSTAAQRQCASEMEYDVERIDKWEECLQADLAAKHQQEREAISARASSRRRSLLSSFGLLLQ
jgi:hypothetical protein